MILPNTAGIEQTTIRYKFSLETEIYILHQNMDKALKQQLLVVVVDIYSRYLKKKYIF